MCTPVYTDYLCIPVIICTPVYTDHLCIHVNIICTPVYIDFLWLPVYTCNHVYTCIYTYTDYLCTPVITRTPVYTDYVWLHVYTCNHVYTCIHGLPVYTHVHLYTRITCVHPCKAFVCIFTTRTDITDISRNAAYCLNNKKNEHSISNEFVFSFLNCIIIKLNEHNIDHAGGVSTTLHQHPRCCPLCCIEIWRLQSHVYQLYYLLISNHLNLKSVLSQKKIQSFGPFQSQKPTHIWRQQRKRQNLYSYTWTVLYINILAVSTASDVLNSCFFCIFFS